MNPFVDNKQVYLGATGKDLVRRSKSAWFAILRVSSSYSVFLLIIQSFSIKINVCAF